MERDTLGLADDSLFIDKIKHLFKTADADLQIQARSFSLEEPCGWNLIVSQAADQLFEQDADAITTASALLAPLLWRGLADPADIRNYFGPLVAASVENIGIPFKSSTDPCQCQRGTIQTLLVSMGGVPRNAFLSITSRLLALKSATHSCMTSARKMVQDMLDLFVLIANRRSQKASGAYWKTPVFTSWPHQFIQA